ncbi:Similar to SLC16A9: Monocarboxylate transporter 9 (Gallus gallus) [Cotesia congregata]|uniref:Similar to SLC16A9: Monocarboxylate transporter 9 (Gallus gallus) n=1 Tax=Cotesia congregata TaxID=51543 RepID=A0A8J2MFT7_COTCN|nr:Similar to SLC16A9: Monocarboxylate transporter 9 (Gallus gallus) [Cotesia congregata]
MEGMLPPDGGWGWMVALGFALNNIVMVPLITGMSLVFIDVFASLELPPTSVSIIMSTNMSFGMAMGLLHGPLLRKFGYRKVAITGALMFFTGILLTAFSYKFIHFLIAYGLMTSMGVGLSMAAFSLALNTYFLEKRGRAMGLAMTITGFGPILMPQLISLLLYIYSAQGTIIILGGITMHTLVAALLLQPVKWHAKRPVTEPKDNEDKQDDKKLIIESKTKNMSLETVKLDVSSNNFELKRTRSISNLNIDDKDSQKEIVETEILTVDSRRRSIYHSQSAYDIIEAGKDKSLINEHAHKWWTSGKSVNSIHLGSCPMIFDDTMIYGAVSIDNIDKNEDSIKLNGKELKKIDEESGLKDKQDESKSEQSGKSEVGGCCARLTRVLHRIVNVLDLRLLCDPIYVNLMLGLSIAAFAEINFSILMPFILNEIQFTKVQIAAVMSTMGFVDLMMRGVSPFIAEWLRQTPRKMYLVSLLMLILSRSIVTIFSDFTSMIIMAVGIGFAKGSRSVFMSLVVPSYVPIERLAHATGIQIFVNGVIIGALSPVLGIIREAKGNYVPCIFLINLMSAITIVMWSAEMIISSRRKNGKSKEYKAVT